MAQLTINVASASASVNNADISALQATAAAAVALLADSTDAVAACAVVTMRVTGDTVISMKTSLNRDAALANLRAAVELVRLAPVWPPT